MPLLTCPFHDDVRPSLSLDVEKGVFHCFGCGAGGDTFTLAILLGLSVRDALAAAYGDGDGTFRMLLEPRRTRTWDPQVTAPSSRAMSWMASRGIQVNETGQVLLEGVEYLPRFLEGDGVLAIDAWAAVLHEGPPERVVWSVWRTYRVMRHRGGSKYLSSSGFPRGRAVGVVGIRPGDYAYITEGVFDALAVLLAQQRGDLPSGSVYCTYGAHPTHAQFTVLRALVGKRQVALAYDKDVAGWDATLALVRVFPHAAVVQYPGNDPGDQCDGPWGLRDGMEWLASQGR